MEDLREIQEQVSRRIIATPLVTGLMAGKMTRVQYKAYLKDVYFYARHSAVVIGLAATRLVHSHPRLASYLFHHAQEETGHDLWVASDLRDLGMHDDQINGIQPSSACMRMVGLEYYWAGYANPVGLVGWMFVLESLGGRVGGGVATAIDRTLGLNGQALYFLRGHAEADAHHSEDLYNVISENVTSPLDLNEFYVARREAETLYCSILDGAFEQVD